MRIYIRLVQGTVEQYRKRVGKPGGKVARKSYEVSLKVRVDVEDLTDELVRSRLQQADNYEEVLHSPETWRIVERRRRLLEALLEDEAALERYIGSHIADLLMDDLSLVDQATEQIRYRVGESDVAEDVVMTVLNRLEPEDARFFENSIETGLLLEHMDELDDCIRERLVEAKFGDITPGRRSV